MMNPDKFSLSTLADAFDEFQRRPYKARQNLADLARQFGQFILPPDVRQHAGEELGKIPPAVLGAVGKVVPPAVGIAEAITPPSVQQSAMEQLPFLEGALPALGALGEAYETGKAISSVVAPYFPQLKPDPDREQLHMRPYGQEEIIEPGVPALGPRPFDPLALDRWTYPWDKRKAFGLGDIFLNYTNPIKYDDAGIAREGTGAWAMMTRALDAESAPGVIPPMPGATQKQYDQTLTNMKILEEWRREDVPEISYHPSLSPVTGRDVRKLQEDIVKLPWGMRFILEELPYAFIPSATWATKALNKTAASAVAKASPNFGVRLKAYADEATERATKSFDEQTRAASKKLGEVPIRGGYNRWMEALEQAIRPPQIGKLQAKEVLANLGALAIKPVALVEDLMIKTIALPFRVARNVGHLTQKDEVHRNVDALVEFGDELMAGKELPELKAVADQAGYKGPLKFSPRTVEAIINRYFELMTRSAEYPNGIPDAFELRLPLSKRLSRQFGVGTAERGGLRPREQYKIVRNEKVGFPEDTEMLSSQELYDQLGREAPEYIMPRRVPTTAEEAIAAPGYGIEPSIAPRIPREGVPPSVGEGVYREPGRAITDPAFTDPAITDPYFNALGRIPDEYRTLSSGERIRIPGRSPSQARFENLELHAPEELAPGGVPRSTSLARKLAKELGLDMNEMRPVVQMGQEGPRIYKKGPKGTVRWIDNPLWSRSGALFAPRYRRLTPDLVDEWAKLKESGEFLLRDHQGWIKPSVDRADILKATQTVFARSRRPYFIRPWQTQSAPEGLGQAGFKDPSVPYPEALVTDVSETRNVIRALSRKEGLNTDQIRIKLNRNGRTSLEQELLDRLKRTYGPEAELTAIRNLINLDRIAVESAESNIAMPLESLGREPNTFTSIELKGLGNLGIDTEFLNAPTPSWRQGSSALDAVTGRSTTSNLPPMLRGADPGAQRMGWKGVRPGIDPRVEAAPLPEDIRWDTLRRGVAAPSRARVGGVEAVTGRAPFEGVGREPYGTIKRTRQDDLASIARQDTDINYNWRPDPDHFINTPNALPRNEMALKARRAIIGDAGNKAIENYTAKGDSTLDLMTGGRGNEDAVMTAISKVADSRGRGRAIADIFIDAQVRLNDQLYPLRKMQDNYMASKHPGGLFKIVTDWRGGDEDIVTKIILASGKVLSGATRYMNHHKYIVEPALARGVTKDDLNKYMISKHWLGDKTLKRPNGIVDNHPGRKALPDVILDDKDPTRRLTSMQVQSEGGSWADDAVLRKTLEARGVENADESLAALKEAAEGTRNIYIDIRSKLVRAGIMTKETSDLLAHHYPWYNPINYVEYANRIHKGKDYNLKNVLQGGKFNLKHDGFYEFSEQPEVMGALPPLGETLLTSLIRNEMRVTNNEITKAVVKMGIATKIGLRNVSDKFANKMVDYDEAAKSGYLIFYDDGVRQVYGGSDGGPIPKWLWESLNGTGGLNLRGQDPGHAVVQAIAMTTGFYRSLFTTYSPIFFSRNALNDSFTAWARAGVLPPQTYQRMVTNLWDAAFQVERRMTEAMTYTGARRPGFYQYQATFDTPRDLKTIHREIMEKGHLEVATVVDSNTSQKELKAIVAGAAEAAATGSKLKTVAGKTKRALPTTGYELEWAGREVVGEKLLKKRIGIKEFRRIFSKNPDKPLLGEFSFKNWRQAFRSDYGLNRKDWEREMLQDWRPHFDPDGKPITLVEGVYPSRGPFVESPEALHAGHLAVESTLNFGRGGSMVKQINPMILFLNAQMEGFKQPFRSLGIDLWPNAKPVENPVRGGPHWEFGKLTPQMAAYNPLGKKPTSTAAYFDAIAPSFNIPESIPVLGPAFTGKEVNPGAALATAFRLGMTASTYFYLNNAWNKQFKYNGVPLYYDIPEWVRHNSMILIYGYEKDEDGNPVIDQRTGRPRPLYLTFPKNYRDWWQVLGSMVMLDEMTDGYEEDNYQGLADKVQAMIKTGMASGNIPAIGGGGPGGNNLFGGVAGAIPVPPIVANLAAVARNKDPWTGKDAIRTYNTDPASPLYTSPEDMVDYDQSETFQVVSDLLRSKYGMVDGGIVEETLQKYPVDAGSNLLQRRAAQAATPEGSQWMYQTMLGGLFDDGLDTSDYIFRRLESTYNRNHADLIEKYMPYFDLPGYKLQLDAEEQQEFQLAKKLYNKDKKRIDKDSTLLERWTPENADEIPLVQKMKKSILGSQTGGLESVSRDRMDAEYDVKDTNIAIEVRNAKARMQNSLDRSYKILNNFIAGTSVIGPNDAYENTQTDIIKKYRDGKQGAYREYDSAKDTISQSPYHRGSVLSLDPNVQEKYWNDFFQGLNDENKQSNMEASISAYYNIQIDDPEGRDINASDYRNHELAQEIFFKGIKANRGAAFAEELRQNIMLGRDAVAQREGFGRDHSRDYFSVGDQYSAMATTYHRSEREGAEEHGPKGLMAVHAFFLRMGYDFEGDFDTQVTEIFHTGIRGAEGLARFPMTSENPYRKAFPEDPDYRIPPNLEARYYRYKEKTYNLQKLEMNRLREIVEDPDSSREDRRDAEMVIEFINDWDNAIRIAKKLMMMQDELIHSGSNVLEQNLLFWWPGRLTPVTMQGEEYQDLLNSKGKKRWPRVLINITEKPTLRPYSTDIEKEEIKEKMEAPSIPSIPGMSDIKDMAGVFAGFN